MTTYSFYLHTGTTATGVNPLPSDLQMELWRPSLTELVPAGMPGARNAMVWALFHYGHLFANRDYSILLIRRGTQVVHRSFVFPGWFRFPFMVVVMFEAIYYLRDPDRFVREARRVLKPGGVFLLATANCDLYDFTPSPYSVRYHGVAELSALLECAGFQPSFFGDTDVLAVSWRQRVFRPLKMLATVARIMPENKTLKAFLKRIVFGPVRRLPAELTAGFPNVGLSLAPIAPHVPDRRHKVVFCAARRAP